jgi:hypothetical protein
MAALRGIASGVLTVLGALGTAILFMVVLIALPLSVAGVLVDYVMFRPAREHLIRLRRVAARPTGDGDT